MMNGAWGSAAQSNRASARFEISRMKQGRGLFDTREDVINYLRGEDDMTTSVRLPADTQDFNPNSYYHNSLAWCLAHCSRESLSEKELGFRASAYVAWGILYAGDPPHRKAREIKTLLDLYEEWWRIGSKMLRPNERFRTFDLRNLKVFHAKELACWAELRLGFQKSLESATFDPMQGDFKTR